MLLLKELVEMLQVHFGHKRRPQLRQQIDWCLIVVIDVLGVVWKPFAEQSAVFLYLDFEFRLLIVLLLMLLALILIRILSRSFRLVSAGRARQVALLLLSQQLRVPLVLVRPQFLRLYHIWWAATVLLFFA